MKRSIATSASSFRQLQEQDIRRVIGLAIVLGVMSWGQVAQATVINFSTPGFDGPVACRNCVLPSSSLPIQNVFAHNFAVPLASIPTGEGITALLVSGRWGDSVVNSSAGGAIKLDGVIVANTGNAFPSAINHSSQIT
jgi:hypothetical protein